MRAPPGNTAWRTADASLGGQLASSAAASAMAKDCSMRVIAFIACLLGRCREVFSNDNLNCHLLMSTNIDTYGAAVNAGLFIQYFLERNNRKLWQRGAAG
jgi:hypothetical protein